MEGCSKCGERHVESDLEKDLALLLSYTFERRRMVYSAVTKTPNNLESIRQRIAMRNDGDEIDAGTLGVTLQIRAGSDILSMFYLRCNGSQWLENECGLFSMSSKTMVSVVPKLLSRCHQWFDPRGEKAKKAAAVGARPHP